MRDQLKGELRHRVDRLARRPVLPAAAVSIEFDDGYRSAHRVALPLVESHGWRPTQYIVTGTPSTEMGATRTELMDDAEVRDWAARADVGSHTTTHSRLDRLDAAAVRHELLDSKAALEDLLGRPVDLFAAPFGASTEIATAIARDTYASQRLVGGRANTPRLFSPWTTHGLLVKRTTTDADLRGWLALAARRRSWLVLVWHRVGEGTEGLWDTPARDFRRQLALVEESGIEVVSSRDMLDRLRTAITDPASG